jgi:hypothetical protein
VLHVPSLTKGQNNILKLLQGLLDRAESCPLVLALTGFPNCLSPNLGIRQIVGLFVSTLFPDRDMIGPTRRDVNQRCQHNHAQTNNSGTTTFVTMDTKDGTKSPATKPVVPQRPIANSLKSILQSRHPNTRREIKRPPSEPIIYDMIVVKNYAPMDSLREILDCPAQIYGPPPILPEIEESKEIPAPAPIEDTVTSESVEGNLGKRKRDDEPMATPSDQEAEKATKKRRISIGIEDILNIDVPKSPHLSPKKILAPGKENIPPATVNVLQFFPLTI